MTKAKLINFIKFASSSGSAAIIDLIVFHFAADALTEHTKAAIIIAAIISRIISGIYNYIINKTFVFESKKSIGRSGSEYALLAVCKTLASGGIVTGIVKLTSWYPTPVKAFTDIVLFFFGYLVQKKIIFNDKKLFS